MRPRRWGKPTRPVLRQLLRITGSAVSYRRGNECWYSVEVVFQAGSHDPCSW